MMKTKLILALFVLSLCLNITSCVSVRVKSRPDKGHTIPPGQVKKMTGSKSARDYAPGHNK